jgi:hypothetical protein
MWFAVAIIGVIAIATGISVLPGGMPKTSSPPPAASAPPNPAPTPVSKP